MDSARRKRQKHAAVDVVQTRRAVMTDEERRQHTIAEHARRAVMTDEERRQYAIAEQWKGICKVRKDDSSGEAKLTILEANAIDIVHGDK
jgi:hypothetical protein